MIDIEEAKELYLNSMLSKAQRMVDKIKAYPFVKDCVLDGMGVKITFNEKVDAEGQDLLDLFLHGGVIKKSSGSKDKESSYIKVESIGEF
jgi:hypothetical protein